MHTYRSGENCTAALLTSVSGVSLELYIAEHQTATTFLNFVTVPNAVFRTGASDPTYHFTTWLANDYITSGGSYTTAPLPEGNYVLKIKDTNGLIDDTYFQIYVEETGGVPVSETSIHNALDSYENKADWSSDPVDIARAVMETSVYDYYTPQGVPVPFGNGKVGSVFNRLQRVEQKIFIDTTMSVYGEKNGSEERPFTDFTEGLRFASNARIKTIVIKGSGEVNDTILDGLTEDDEEGNLVQRFLKGYNFIGIGSPKIYIEVGTNLEGTSFDGCWVLGGKRYGGNEFERFNGSITATNCIIGGVPSIGKPYGLSGSGIFKNCAILDAISPYSNDTSFVNCHSFAIDPSIIGTYDDGATAYTDVFRPSIIDCSRLGANTLSITGFSGILSITKMDNPGSVVNVNMTTGDLELSDLNMSGKIYASGNANVITNQSINVDFYNLMENSSVFATKVWNEEFSKIHDYLDSYSGKEQWKDQLSETSLHTYLNNYPEKDLWKQAPTNLVPIVSAINGINGFNKTDLHLWLNEYANKADWGTDPADITIILDAIATLPVFNEIDFHAWLNTYTNKNLWKNNVDFSPVYAALDALPVKNRIEIERTQVLGKQATLNSIANVLGKLENTDLTSVLIAIRSLKNISAEDVRNAFSDVNFETKNTEIEIHRWLDSYSNKEDWKQDPDVIKDAIWNEIV